MNRTGTTRLTRLAGDLAAGLLAFYGSFTLRIHVRLPLTTDLLPGDRLRFLEQGWLEVLLSQVVLLYLFGFYDPPRPRARVEAARGLLAVTSLQALALMGFFFLTSREFPRSVLLLFAPLNLALLYGWRRLLDRLHRPGERRVAIVGSGPSARELADKITSHRWHGLVVAGFVPAPGEPVPETAGPLGPRLGELDDLPELLAEGRIEDIVLVPGPTDWQTRLLDSLAGVRPTGASVLLLPGPFESLIGRMRYRWVRDLPLIEVVSEWEWRLRPPLKRGLDLVVGSLLFLLGLPLMLAVAALVRVTSPGPVLYRQVRVGRGQRPFTLLKFRTMHPGAEDGVGEVLAQAADPRLTLPGAALRRYRLDELPQLLNVLRGTMSLVGPRPERPGFVHRYLREVPGYAERFAVAPGLTGLAQINGDYHSSAENKLRYDLAYLANWSIWLDLSILFQTVKSVLTSRGV